MHKLIDWSILWKFHFSIYFEHNWEWNVLIDRCNFINFPEKLRNFAYRSMEQKQKLFNLDYSRHSSNSYEKKWHHIPKLSKVLSGHKAVKIKFSMEAILMNQFWILTTSVRSLTDFNKEPMWILLLDWPSQPLIDPTLSYF